MNKLKIVIIASFCIPLFACGNNAKKRFDGLVEFQNTSVSYNTLSHQCRIQVRPGAQLPSDFAVVYSYLDKTSTTPFAFVDSGTYRVSATLAANDYETTTLSADFTIVGKQWPPMRFNNVEANYNAAGVYKIADDEFINSAPANSTFEFYCDEFKSEKTGPTIIMPELNAGEHSIKAIVYNPAYADSRKTFNASLTINRIDLDPLLMKYHFVNESAPVDKQDLRVEVDPYFPGLESCPDCLSIGPIFYRPNMGGDWTTNQPTIPGIYHIKTDIEYLNYNTYTLISDHYQLYQPTC